jgi:hydrogenase nickel incorporation protein HypA/HybF
MHELPLVQSIIAKASQHAREHGAGKVKAISLVVGEGSGYVPESIQMYFDIISFNTSCEGAEIKVTRIKPLMKCDSCGKLFERRPFSFECPDCGSPGSPTDVGSELYIDYIEIETDKGDDKHEGNASPEGDGGIDGRERPAGGGDERCV